MGTSVGLFCFSLLISMLDCDLWAVVVDTLCLIFALRFGLGVLLNDLPLSCLCY